MKLSEAEKSIIRHIRELKPVQWDEPYAHPYKRGIYISLTEDTTQAAYVSWKEWEASILDNDPEALDDSIQLLQASLDRIKAKRNLMT